MRILTVLVAAALCGASACASPQASPPPDAADTLAGTLEAALDGDYGVSPAAMATAVRGPDGKPVGLAAYDRPLEAIRVGDIAAFIAMVRLAGGGEEDLGGVGAVILAVDRIADEDNDAARALLDAGRGSDYGDPIIDFVDAWIHALEGEAEKAIEAHRAADAGLPGLTAELSLAAMLEAMGRTDEALAVYASMTPSKIEAPRHQFDPKGILFRHVEIVIARRTLLLRKLGRTEEAKDVYRRLQEAEPEQAARYAAALDSLETGRGIELEDLDIESAFARSLSDLSTSLYQSRLIRNAMMGQRLRGLDQQRITLDMLAMISDPGSEGLRENVISQLYGEAFYQGAAHIAQTAPEPTAGLALAAAQAWLMVDERARARDAVEQAVALAEEDDRISVLSGAVGLHALMGDEDEAVDRARAARQLARNDAERASTASLYADTLNQFGRADEAVALAREARDLDDTHDRRMQLANILGEAGLVEEGLQMIRRERLKRPNDPYMLNTLGYYLIENTDRLEEGFKVLHGANAMARNDAYIADSLGWAYYKLGHLDEALRLIENSRDELAPRLHWEIEDHYGDILWHLDRRDEAVEAWSRALGEFPPHKTEMSIREKLENGLVGPRPEEQNLPSMSLDEKEVRQRKT